ncbi:hypothetical protein VNI00_013548 [Paramarasmius palmivorus]|uniref:Uncharacterized protein n=1 Tax=Paramarasmius palmivorus TaxID=297713 RepID=A0AAW0C0L3_9AGAR
MDSVKADMYIYVGSSTVHSSLQLTTILKTTTLSIRLFIHSPTHAPFSTMRFIVPSVSLSSQSLTGTQQKVWEARGFSEDEVLTALKQKRNGAGKIDTQELRQNEELAPFGVETFYEWYKTLTPEKRKALMVSMMSVCKERARQGGKNKPVRLEKESAEEVLQVPSKEISDPNDLAFQWRLEADDCALVVQFTKWYTALSEEEQGGALAYSAMKDGDNVEEAESELEKVRDLSGLQALTRKQSEELTDQAHSYVQARNNCVVVPNFPTCSRDTDEGQHETSVVYASDEALPRPPAPGLRAKVTRGGTLILDKWGDPIWEKIPEQSRGKM